MTIRVGEAAEAPSFQKAAFKLLDDAQLRKNVRHATDDITGKRAIVVGEQHDWQQLRSAASAIKQHTLAHLDEYLLKFDTACTAAGGHVHWASDADEANGIRPHETDLADMIVQLGHDKPSHIVVPALHKNRQQVREIFAREMGLPELTDGPQALTAAARQYLREKFLRVK